MSSSSFSSPRARHLVLAGGGHAHALLLRQWSGDPLPDVSLTLVSPDALTPYSGMLPGLVAGHYRFEDIHIDLQSLCRAAGARFLPARVTGIDAGTGRVSLDTGETLPFDLLSLDTGSTSPESVPGVAEHATTIKPIARFYDRWLALQAQIRRQSQPLRIALVGGGAGSVEIALAMAWACRRDPAVGSQPTFHLVFQAGGLLPGYPEKVSRIASDRCRALGVELHERFRVSAVQVDHLAGASGQSLPVDVVLWCTEAAAPHWPREAGLACDENGFVAVNAGLQSTSHPAIFAAGDIAYLIDDPVPKAGVYAVRQAPYLFENLRRRLSGSPLKSYRPQQHFLSLLALGGREAVGCRGSLSFHGRWAWYWKDHIDRRFMARFDLPSR